MFGQLQNKVTVSRGTVTVGHQTYPLANIARLQVLRVDWSGRSRLRRVGKPMVVFVAAVVVLIGLVVSSGDATGTLSALVLLAVSAAGIWLALALRSKRRLSLLIETAGGHVGAISSRSSSNDDVIDSLHEAIVR